MNQSDSPFQCSGDSVFRQIPTSLCILLHACSFCRQPQETNDTHTHLSTDVQTHACLLGHTQTLPVERCPTNRRSWRRIRCRRSGCLGWAASWAAGEGVSYTPRGKRGRLLIRSLFLSISFTFFLSHYFFLSLYIYLSLCPELLHQVCLCTYSVTLIRILITQSAIMPTSLIMGAFFSLSVGDTYGN